MSSSLLLLAMCWEVFVTEAGEAIADTDNVEDDCEGSLKLITAGGDEVEVTEDMEEMDIEVVKAVTEGCGCYRLWEKSNKRGKSFHLNSIGTHSFPIRKVGSLSYTACGRGAMAGWSICLIVVGVVSVTGMMVGVLYKRMGDRHVPGARPELCQHQEIL